MVRLLGRLLVAGVLVTTVLGPGPGMPARAAEATITWPEVTHFNPDTTPYIIDVDYDGEGTLFLWFGWNDSTVMLEPNGPQEVVFPAIERNTELLLGVVECPEPEVSWECPLVARSPELAVYSDAAPVLDWGAIGEGDVGPTETLRFASHPTFDAWDVAWEVVPVDDRSAPALISGQVAGMPSSGRLPAIGQTPALVSGEQYVYRATVSGDVPLFGYLDSVIEEVFRWDAAAPVFTLDVGHSTGYPDYDVVNDDVFYPVEDGYLDSVIAAASGQDTDIDVGTVVVTDEAGIEVFRDADVDDFPHVVWDGRDPDGQVLPEGDYRVSMIARDKNGNATIESRTIALSHDRYVERTWRPSFAPNEVTVRSSVGACGRVKQPARPAWRGSVGLYTSDGCRPRRQQFSRAVHRVDLPLTSDDTVLSASLTVEGAKSRRERASSVWIRLRNGSTGRWRSWVEVTSRRAPVEIAVPVSLITVEEPELRWEARVSDGDSFDLRGFTVDLRYRAFGPEAG